MTHKWKPIPTYYGVTTYCKEFEDFYISYNPKARHPYSKEGEVTALCQGDNFYLLEGDYRSGYDEVCEQGFDVCLDFFSKQEGGSVHLFNEEVH